MRDLNVELTIECPKCEEQSTHEFDLDIVQKHVGGFYMQSRRSKARCENCGFNMDLFASGEVEVETT